MVIETIVALMSAPLLLAVSKKKPAKAKRGRPPTKTSAKTPAKASKRAPAKPGRKQQLVSASQKAPPEPEPVVEAEPMPPPPPPVPPVQTPQLFSPGNGEVADSVAVGFRWLYVGGASLYQLMWSTEPQFRKPRSLLTSQTAATLPPEEALEPATNVFWRVRAGNEGGWGPWSATRTFRTPG